MSDEGNSIVLSIKEKYAQKYQENPVLTIFVSLMLVFILVNFLFAIVTGGKTFLYMLHPFPDYVLMDHFSMVVYSIDHPYTRDNPVIYPPLITLAYGVIAHYTVPFVKECDSIWDLATSMRTTEMPVMVLVVAMMAVFVSLYFIYQKYSEKQFKRQEYNVIFILLLFSYPVLFGLSTGNCIFLSLLFTILYVYYHDSENKNVRMMSYLFLGIAAGIKIVPAVFGILTLKRFGVVEFAKCVVIVSVLLLAPFIFTDGDPITFFTHTISYGSTVPSTFGILGINDIALALGWNSTIVTGIKLLVIGVVLAAIVFDEKMKKWEAVTLLGALVMIAFSVSVPYTLIYVMIGLVIFLNSEKVINRYIMLVLCCLIVIIAPLPGFELGQTYVGTIKGVVMMALTIILVSHSVKRIIESSNDAEDKEETKGKIIRKKKRTIN